MPNTSTSGQSYSSEWGSHHLYISGPDVKPGFRARFQHEEKEADPDVLPKKSDRKSSPPTEGDEGGGGSYTIKPAKESSPMGTGANRKPKRRK